MAKINPKTAKAMYEATSKANKEKPLTPKQQLKLEVDTMKKDTNKPEQVKTLLDFGLTKKQVRELKNENNRVKKILELQKKDKK